ncbi:hypothetical protein EJB05_15523 [Eragrostis curvula]|uniref:GDSL esterase/lipase n=1 Tax=Eragrostis curvula TaxID=38414 RepID=A0A5J9W1X6_9POAL|nr:hypothetical protein EJB05_15523 [Eragrostis curvula]
MKIVPLALCLFLALAGGGDVVEAGRRSRHRRPDYKLLVLGDSYVDAGNLPRSADRSLTSRGWYWPYGISDGNRPSGRFSDGMVQSDFVARILGLDESPPAYSTLGPKDDVDPSGVNLAVGGSGVLMGTPTLGQQVDQLRSLMMAMGRGVTDEIRSVVKRLLDDVGVVNTMPPMGCVPWESARNNHTRCESRGNMMSDVHNTALRQKLAEFKQARPGPPARPQLRLQRLRAGRRRRHHLHQQTAGVLRCMAALRRLLRPGGPVGTPAVHPLPQPRPALLLGLHAPHPGRMEGRHGHPPRSPQGVPTQRR